MALQSSLVPDCCPPVCPWMSGWRVGSKSPRLPSRDPWLALDFGALICLFRRNRLSDIMALCEISHVILPVLLSDLVWSRPVTFPQLALPSSHAPRCSSCSSWHLIMLCDPCPRVWCVHGLNVDFRFLLGIIYHCDLTKEELEPRVFREVTVKGIDASDYQTVQVWRSVCSW